MNGAEPPRYRRAAKSRLALAGTVLLSLMTGGACAWAQASAQALEPLDGARVIARVLEHSFFGFKKGTAVVEMRTQLTDGRTLLRRMMIWTSRDTKGHERTRIRLLDPPSVRGTELLLLENNDVTEQYLYTPRLGRTRRIAGTRKDARFLGTDVTYADLDFTILKRGTPQLVGDDEVGGIRAYQVVVDRIKKGPYGRIEVWADTRWFLPIKILLYGPTGQLIKEFRVLRIGKEDDKAWIRRMRIRDKRRASETTVELLERHEEDVPDQVFERSALGR